MNTGKTVGWLTGEAANAVLNVYGVEKGSFSRQLYNLVDANGNRISDFDRDWYSRIYALIASALEFATPEPGISTLMRSSAVKEIVGNSVLDSIYRIGMNAAGGAISESFEEMLQQTTQTATQNIVKYISNQKGDTQYDIAPLEDQIADSIASGIEAFSQTLIPSFLVGGVSDTGIALTRIGTRELSRKFAPLSTPTAEQQRAAESRQERDDTSKAVPIRAVKMKRGRPTRDYSATTEGEGGESSSPSKLPVINVRNDKFSGKLVPISEEDADVAKYLRDTGADTVFVHVQGEDIVVEDSDLSGAAEQHGGFLDSDTNAIYVSNKEDIDAIRSDLGSAITRTENVDDSTTRITYRNSEGEESSIDIIADPTLSDVLTEQDTSYDETAETTVNTPNVANVTAAVDSWQSRPAEWFNSGEFTSEMGRVISENPSEARNVLKGGLYSYIRKVNPEIDEVQADAMADANALLMIHLANAAGTPVGEFVSGIKGLGVINDPAVRGRYIENGGERRLLLNPELMSPTTFTHEVGHYFLSTLPDGSVKDSIIDTYREQYTADGNAIGQNTQEAFSNGLAEYVASGKAANPEIRNIFQRLLDAMKAFIDRLRGEGLSAKQQKLYDDLFAIGNTDTVFNEEVENSPAVYAATGSQAKAILRDIRGIEFANKNDGLIARLGVNGIDKIVSDASRKISNENGFTNEEHFTAAANVPRIFENGVLIEEHPDRNGNPDLVVRNYGTPVSFGNTGRTGIARTVVKVNRNNPNTIYALDLLGLEKNTELSSSPAISALESINGGDNSAQLRPSSMPKSESINGGDNSAQLRPSDSIVNLPSGSNIVNDEISYNESVEDNLTPEQRALRDRIRRGRQAQAARRARFFQNIDAMMDNNLFVEASDLVTYRNSIESEIDNRRKNGENVTYADDPRWQKIHNELVMRDKMLLYPPSYAEEARGNKSRAEFVGYVRKNSGHPDSFTEEEVRVAEKYYGYVNTPDAKTQVRSFVSQYSTKSSLLALKQILGPRRVASKSRSGRVFTRLYIPTSKVWQEIRDLTNNSSSADVQAILSSIQQNPDEWYQAYLNALISGSRTGRTTAADTSLDLEAVAMAYYAGKKNSEGSFYENLARRNTESDKDTKRASSAIDSSTEEGRRAAKIKREDSFSDTYIERVVPKTLAEVQLEKDRARAREAIGHSERAIKRMTNTSLSTTDARFIPVAKWLYAYMHGGRKGIFAELDWDSADRYQDVIEGVESPEDSDTMFRLYPDIEEDAEGIPQIYRGYDEYTPYEGVSANLGGFRFEQSEIPQDLLNSLPESTAETIRSGTPWNQLAAEDIVNIANAFKMAKQWAQDIQSERKRQRLARYKGKSIPVAQRLLMKGLRFTPAQLHDVGRELGLERDATSEEAMDYYRKNPARLIDSYDDATYLTKAERDLKKLKDAGVEAYLGFVKIQRFTRALDGEENGPIFNAFYRDIFESYQNMLTEIQRRDMEAQEAFAPIIGNPDDKSLTPKQRIAERKKRDDFKSMMQKAHVLAASFGLSGERNTRTLNGWDLLQMYLNSLNINGFEKLIDPDHGSGISLEALMDYVPEQVAEFVDLELKLRQAVVDERNRINTEWNASELRRMEQDENYSPNFRSTNLTWEELAPDFKSDSFINRTTSDLQKILEKAKSKNSILNPDIKKLGDEMIQLLAKERDRLIDADYQQRNELMTVERNYWPLVGKKRGVGQALNLFNDSKADKALPASGMLKNRRRHEIYDVIGPNPMAIFYSAIETQERFINMGDTLRELDSMWSPHGGNVGEIVERKLGKKTKEYLYDYLRRMAGKDDFNEVLGLDFINGMIPRLQASYIGLSPLTLVRQYVSLINAAARGEVSGSQVLSSLVRYASDKTYREETTERIRALAPEIANTDITQEIAWQRHMEQIQFKSDEMSARARDFFTKWIRFHDKVTKEVTWISAFENARKKGLSEQEAAFKASTLVQETMSVGDPISRSRLQESKNPLTRYLFMFTTDIFNTWNILFGDIPNDWKEGNKLRAIKRLGGVIGVAAALAMIQGGWLPDDDDDELFGVFDTRGFFSDFASELITGIPLAGTLLSDAFSGYPQSVPVVSDTLRNIRNVVSEDSSMGKKIDALIDEAIVSMGTLFGGPVSSARRGINVFYTPEGGFQLNPFAFLNADWEDFGASLFD